MKTLYYNGYIITMNGGKVVGGMLVGENGKIEVAGDFSNVDAIPDSAVKKVDLKGCVVMPSFIDSHSHITAVARTMSLADLNGARSDDDIYSLLTAFKTERGVRDGEWLVGYNYDHNVMKGRRHPDGSVLDGIENPVLITHKSGHMGVLNKKARDILGIESDSDGYLEEAKFIDAANRTPKPSIDVMRASLKEAEKIYLSCGYTVASDGLSGEEEIELLSSSPLDVDVVSIIDYKKKDAILSKYSEYFGRYVGNLKIGGYKIILDGSPQAKTAWLSKPYSGEDSFRGTPYYTDERVEEIMKDAINDGVQLYAHANGDMASEQLIRAYYHVLTGEKLEAKYRPVMIHAQTLRDDQIRRMATLDMIPSFFASHIYHFGDIHRVNLGVMRANKISPIRTSIDYGLNFTLHNDSPVVPPSVMELISSAVNRITKNGAHIGTFEKVEAYEAFEGTTINAAYQYFEEKERGSIEEGKAADFIIIDKNPYEIDREDISSIKVLATFKSGRVLYRNDLCIVNI